MTKAKKIDFRSKKLVYYGPYTCESCGALIVKAGNNAPDYLEFNFAHSSHYPNHIWKQHVCGGNKR